MFKSTDTSRVVDFKLLGRLFQVLARFHNPLKPAKTQLTIFHSLRLLKPSLWLNKPPNTKSHLPVQKL